MCCYTKGTSVSRCITAFSPSNFYIYRASYLWTFDQFESHLMSRTHPLFKRWLLPSLLPDYIILINSKLHEDFHNMRFSLEFNFSGQNFSVPIRNALISGLLWLLISRGENRTRTYIAGLTDRCSDLSLIHYVTLSRVVITMLLSD